MKINVVTLLRGALFAPTQRLTSSDVKKRNGKKHLVAYCIPNNNTFNIYPTYR